MSFLLYEGRYCLIKCWPFNQVSRSFCDLRTRTRLLPSIKYPGNIQFNKLKRPRIDSPPLRCVRLLFLSALQLWNVFKMAFWGLRSVFSSPIINLNFQLGMRLTQLVTSLGCFGRAIAWMHEAWAQKKSWLKFWSVRFWSRVAALM